MAESRDAARNLRALERVGCLVGLTAILRIRKIAFLNKKRVLYRQNFHFCRFKYLMDLFKLFYIFHFIIANRNQEVLNNYYLLDKILVQRF